jgi:hypothetical protein
LFPFAPQSPRGTPPFAKSPCFPECDSSGVLDPFDRGLELLGGVVMVLTFTSSLSVSAGEADVRAMLVEPLGCNLAWGIIDAIV